MLRWNQLDPKILSALIAGALGYAVTKLALPWDPKLEQAVNLVAALAAGYLTSNHTDDPPEAEGDDTVHAQDPLIVPEESSKPTRRK